MDKNKMLWIASKYISKGYSFEQMCYGDEVYHLEGQIKAEVTDEIGEYMVEMRDIGKIAFYEKYKEFKLY